MSARRGPGRPTTGERVEVRLPADLIAAADAEAEARGTTRAKVLREWVARGSTAA